MSALMMAHSRLATTGCPTQNQHSADSFPQTDARYCRTLQQDASDPPEIAADEDTLRVNSALHCMFAQPSFSRKYSRSIERIAGLPEAAIWRSLFSSGAVPAIELVEKREELVVIDVVPRHCVGFKHEALAGERQEVECRGRLVGQLGVAMTCVT
jgi:hypothetical protein